MPLSFGEWWPFNTTFDVVLTSVTCVLGDNWKSGVVINEWAAGAPIGFAGTIGKLSLPMSVKTCASQEQTKIIIWWFTGISPHQTYVDIWNWENSFAICDTSFEPIFIHASRQHNQFTFVQRQFDSRLCIEIEFGACLTFWRFSDWQSDTVSWNDLWFEQERYGNSVWANGEDRRPITST